MERDDPLARALLGVGCALIIGAPLIATAAACTSGSLGAPESTGHPGAPPAAVATATAARQGS